MDKNPRGINKPIFTPFVKGISVKTIVVSSPPPDGLFSGVHATKVNTIAKMNRVIFFFISSS